MNKDYEKALARTENILTALASPEGMALRKARWECVALVSEAIGAPQMEAAFGREHVWHVHENGNVHGTLNTVNPPAR